MRHLKTLSILGLGLWATSVFAAVPFTVEKPGMKQRHTAATSGVLFEHLGTKVLRLANAQPSEFANVYWIHLSKSLPSAKDVGHLADVLHEERGQFAIVRINENQVNAVSAKLHKSGLACGSLFKVDGDVMTDDVIAAPTPSIPVDQKLDRVVQAVTKIDSARIKKTIEELSALETRFHDTNTGKRVIDLLIPLYQALAQGRDDVTIEAYDHGSKTDQLSLIVRIKGQTKPDELVLLGSHIDSVNWEDGSDSRAPGADDNASGTATNLEVFRVLMEQGVRLDRTLEIHGYAAEEAGLVGSQDMARRYKQAQKKVVAMVQQDMNIYNEGRDMIWLVSNDTNSALNNALGKLIDQYVGLPWDKAPLYDGSSDHYSWTRQGYAAAFPFENPKKYNKAIHTERDSLSNARALSQAAGFAKLVISYVSHFAGWQGEK